MLPIVEDDPSENNTPRNTDTPWKTSDLWQGAFYMGGAKRFLLLLPQLQH